MKLKSQLIISIIIFAIILLIISASIIVTNQQATQINNLQKTAGNIQNGASNLAYISNDYFLYQDNAQLTQWQSQFSTLSEDISTIKSTNSEQAKQINNVETDLQNLGAIFNSSVSFLVSAPRNESVRVLPEFQNDWSRLAVQNQGLAFDASVLSNSLENQTNQMKQTNDLLIFALVSAFAAYFIIFYLIVFRRTFRSITKLQEGTRIIGSGNLDYTVGSNSNNEIGELSRSFNQMTANLKTVTASKTDLEKAQASLRESEQRWSTTLSSIGDAVIATDVSGKISFMNHVAEELTGWTLSEASLKPVKDIFNIINEQTGLEVENPIAKILREGMVVGLANHTVLIRKDGSEVPIDDSGAPIKNKEGKTTGVVLKFRDISERKQTEAALKEASEQTESDRKRLETILETSPSAVVIIDASNGKFSYVNKRAMQLYGFDTLGLSLDENVAKVKARRVDGTDYPIEEMPVTRSLTLGEEVHNEEMLIKRPDGQVLPIIASTAPLRDMKGNVTAAIVVFEDITERKKAEEELRKAKENLEEQVQQRTVQLVNERKMLFAILETVPIMVCLLTPDYHVAFANRSFREKFGESESRHCYDYCFGKSEPCGFCESYKPLDTGIPHHWQVNGSDGSVIDAFDFPFTDVDGSKMILEMDIDITEQKRIEKKLKDSERLAAIGATAGMVGHDIRNPLQAITGDLYLAKTELSTLPENELKSNALESLTEIEKNIDYINKIVQDLQDYARPLNPCAQETNIKSVFNEILAKNGIPKNIKVTVEIENKAEKVMADPDYLKRIAANLTLNAVQAMPDGGKLTIHAYADKLTDDVLITVKDTGVGIPEAIKPKLFTPMMTTKSKGQGFGLPVVKRMTEGLGGTVTFESQEGKGTTFIIRLPPPKGLKGK